MLSPQGFCLREPPIAASTCSTTSGTATPRVNSCGKPSGRRPSAAFGCACCSTTRTPAGSTRRSLRSMRIRTSRSGSSIPSRIADSSLPISRSISRASIAACTTSPSRRTTRSRSSAAAMWVTSTTAPVRRSTFQDLDVLAVGPVVREVSREFDLYWNSRPAYPAASVLPPAEPDGASRLREGWEKVHQDPAAVVYLDAVRRTPLVAAIACGRFAGGMDERACGPRRPVEGAGASGTNRPAHAPAPAAGARQTDARARPRVPLLHTGQAGYGRPACARRARRQGARVDELARGDRCCSGPRRLFEVQGGSARLRRSALRAEAQRRGTKGQGPCRAPGHRQQSIRRPACQDIRGGPKPHLRRIVQPRPALGAHQHGDGRCHRVSPPCRPALRAIRLRPSGHGLRSAARDGQTLASNGSIGADKPRLAPRRSPVPVG